MTIADLDVKRAKREMAIEGTRALAESLAKPDPIPEQYVITEPGIYEDIPSAVYHRDPVLGGSLSSTGARRLLKPGGPARYRYILDNPPEDTTEALDFGIAAHQIVLGDPDDRLVVIGPDEWRTNAVKAEVEKARAAGKTPIKPKDMAKIEAMAQAIQDNGTAAALLHSASGKPEQTIVWQDKTTRVWCRARIDWFRTPVAGRRLLVVDYKTTTAADEDSFGKSAADYGYFVQAAFYLEGIRAVGLDPDPAFLLICQEKDPPYLVNVVELDETALHLGRNLMQIALNTYADCTRTGNWPGFGPEVKSVSLPGWFLKRFDEESA